MLHNVIQMCIGITKQCDKGRWKLAPHRMETIYKFREGVHVTTTRGCINSADEIPPRSVTFRTRRERKPQNPSRIDDVQVDDLLSKFR